MNVHCHYICKVPGLTPPQHAITYYFVIVGTGYTTSGNTLDHCSGYTYCEHVTPHIDYCSVFQQL